MNQTPPEPDRPATSTGRGLRLALGAAGLLVALALIGVGAFLVTSSPSKRKDTSGKVLAYRNERPPKSVKFVDGLVIETTPTNFLLLTKKRARVTLDIRTPDRPYIDIQHAQTHAALGQPVRVYHRPYRGDEVVVYMEDSPLIF